MKNKWLIIGIAVVVIMGGIFACSQPIAPTAPTPAQTPTTITEPGVVVLTVEELLNQVIANPNRYKEGTVMRLTGAALDFNASFSTVYFGLGGPGTQGWRVSVMPPRFSGDNGTITAIIKGRVRDYPNDPIITVQATLQRVDPKWKTIDLRDGTLVTNAK